MAFFNWNNMGLLLFVMLWALPAMASPLLQRGFFPTANFVLSWQQYLPADIPLEKLNLYTSDTHVMQPGLQLSMAVHAEVIRISTGFRYSYKVSNSRNSVQSVVLLGLDRRAPISEQAGGALFLNMGIRNPYGNAIVWYSRPDVGARVRVVDVVLGSAKFEIPVSEVGVSPGEAVSGMSFESIYLPGIVTAFGRGKGWLVDMRIGSVVPAPFNEYMSGKTLGPVLLAQDMSAMAFSKYMQGLVTESVALGWLTGDVAVKAKAFANSLETATTSEAFPALYQAFHGYLTGFWFGTSDMTSEGKTLMLLNLEYGMQRFPVLPAKVL